MSAPVAGPSVERYLEARRSLSTPLPDRFNIAWAACDRWADDPGRIAVLVPQDDGDVRAVTFAELRRMSSRLANGLAALGVARGDRVAVVLPQSLECGVAHLAIQRLGAIAVPISVLAGPDGVQHRVEDSGVRVLLADADTHAWICESDFARDLVCVMVGERLPAGARAYEQLITDGAPVREPVDTSIDDPALIIYTSGTTGAPKGALHAQRVVPAHAEPISLAHDGFPREGDVLWSPADWAWGGGLIDCLLAAWNVGHPVVAWRPRKFEPELVLDVLERCAVTNTFLPPTALKLLAEHPATVAAADRLSLRAVMTGGERVGEDIIDWCRATLGIVPNTVYGQTEVSCVLGNSSSLLPVKPGALGMEYPRVRAAILDEAGNEAGPDEEGEIALHRSTAAMFLGYWAGDGAMLPFDGEWHRTGDLGRRDADGYFWHHARKDEVILSAGYRIGPGEVEQCLATHEAVGAVAVIGTPDELRGQVVTAVIELKPGVVAGEALEEELGDHVRRRLAAYERPRRFRFVDALPRTETGKIRRAALRDLVA